MAHVKIHKTSFTAGELSPDVIGRGDLAAYDNGASKLENLFILPTGGVTRRAGLRHVDALAGEGRLVGFEFNTEQVYLLVFRGSEVDVYEAGSKIETITGAPWSVDQLKSLNWVQSADTLLVVHPEVEPQKITRDKAGTWSIAPWAFYTDEAIVHQPYHKFVADDVTLDPSSTTGTITLTASADVFDADHHVGARFRLKQKQVEITAVNSATSATAEVKETLLSAAATKDWDEQAFSSLRGWPTSVCFHQDRLVIGGSRDLPNRLWMSKSADLFNFDLGTGLDDEAIEFAILSDQVNAIRAVFSGRHLQVFTSGAEWMVTGEPLTPLNIQLKRQTRVGVPIERSVPPVDVDGATLFVSRTGDEIREFLFTDVEQAYQAGDLAMLARHLVINPIEQDYDKTRRYLHIVMSDGSIASLTLYRRQSVTAWARQVTNGTFKSIALVGSEAYVLVERAGGHTLEVFDDSYNVDGGLKGSDATPKATWSGLEHLEGQVVTVKGNGTPMGSYTVTGGAVTLETPVEDVEVGLAYTHICEPMPPYLSGAQTSTQGGKVRPIKMTFRLLDTVALMLDVGNGLQAVSFKRFGAQVLDQSQMPFTGDRTVRAFGWRSGDMGPLWRIEQDTPVPFTLLSVTSEISVNG